MKIFVVANTKGGSGKTNTAFNVLPAVLNGCKVIEIDDNNSSSNLYCDSVAVLEKKSITTKEAEEHLQEIVFDLIGGDEFDIVIDAGGGNDSLEVLQTIKSLDLKEYADEIIYIIPVMNSLLQLTNAKQMIDTLGDENVIIALNGVHSFDNIEREWVFWYGSDELDIDSFAKTLRKGIKTIHIPQSYLFELSTTYKLLLKDFAAAAYEISQKEAADKYFKECDGDKELFKRNMTLYRRKKEAKELIEAIKPNIQKALGIGAEK